MREKIFKQIDNKVKAISLINCLMLLYSEMRFYVDAHSSYY